MITTILFITMVAIIGMVVLFIAGDLHDHGKTDEVESFSVSNPDVAKVCDLDYKPDDTPTVRYYNGIAWSTLGTGDYTLSGTTLTVKASAMD